MRREMLDGDAGFGRRRFRPRARFFSHQRKEPKSWLKGFAPENPTGFRLGHKAPIVSNPLGNIPILTPTVDSPALRSRCLGGWTHRWTGTGKKPQRCRAMTWHGRHAAKISTLQGDQTHSLPIFLPCRRGGHWPPAAPFDGILITQIKNPRPYHRPRVFIYRTCRKRCRRRQNPAGALSAFRGPNSTTEYAPWRQ